MGKEHNNLPVVETMNYCRFFKDTGKPLIVCDYKTGQIKTVKKWKIDVYDKDGNPIRIQCEFNNAKGKAKASGATSVLEVRMQ